MITLRSVDLGQRVIYERREKEKFILYHRSVYNRIQGHRTC
jgi:hypothetical protein